MIQGRVKRWLYGLLLMALLLPLPAQAALNIVAVVNDDMISTLDVEERMKFMLATSGVPATQEVLQKMQPQVIRTLIDERLQIQEAKSQGVAVTPDEIAAAYARVDAQRGLPEGSFKEFLQGNGISLETVESQMKAQIGWTKVLYQKLRSRVRVSEEEVQQERERIASGQNVTEYQVSSIVLAVPEPSASEEVKELAMKLHEQIENGANFQALAKQFSAGSSDLVEQNQYRWIQLHQLEPALAGGLTNAEPGDVIQPMRTQAGYHIIKLHDKRTANTSATFDSEMLLKQITMRLKQTAEPREAEVLLDIAREVGKYPGTCQEQEVAGVTELSELNFDVNFQRVTFRNLQPQLQSMLANLRVGDISEPYATPAGIHMVMLCERVELPPQLPPAEAVREKLMHDKLELEGAKRLRDLRREAFIEVRSAEA